MRLANADPSWPVSKIKARLNHLNYYHCRVEEWRYPGDKLFRSEKRGHYALTPLGLEEAKGIEVENRVEEILSATGRVLEDLDENEIFQLHDRVTGDFEAELRSKRDRNITAEWLGEKFKAPGGAAKSELYKLMVRSVASKLPVSAASQYVEDHVQECLLRLIHRDSLRERILAGENITPSHLATYAVRSACSDIRSMGTNPVCREIYGARTETERLKAKAEGTDNGRRWKIKDPRVSFQKDEDGISALVEIADEAGLAVEDVQAFGIFWARMENMLKWRVPGAWPRYAKILRMKLEGGTTKEIAKELGVSSSRTTTMMSVARKILREARDQGFFAQCFDA
jgi:DNA-directed RNA polymerase specialized sigma24 family protein